MQNTNAGDLALQENVAEDLAFDPSVDASDIGVAARNGVVTLTGAVSTVAEKVAAEKAAKRTHGVHGVASELQVEPPATHKLTDADIAAGVINALASSSSVPHNAVMVTVEEGWVTLEGSLERQFQKDQAEGIVRKLLGVRGIANRITVKPHVQIAGVREQLHEAPERHAGVDAAGRPHTDEGDHDLTTMVSAPPATQTTHKIDQPLAASQTADRHQQISDAAYSLAEARHFVPEYELDDWLTAERQIIARERQQSV